jgi:DUF2934 family protein
MDHSLENRIRERAYEIWASHGYVHGQADQHWLAAERADPPIRGEWTSIRSPTD